MAATKRYFYIRVETPYAGERSEHYVSIVMDEDEEPTMNSDFCKIIDDSMFDTATDWYDESEVGEDYETFDDYLMDCDWHWEEISYEEYAAHVEGWRLFDQIHSFEH
jgi:predicted SAM-dependent methyltransferase